MALEGILCGPKSSHTYVDNTINILTNFINQIKILKILFRTFHSKLHFYLNASEHCIIYKSNTMLVMRKVYMQALVAMKFSMWPSIENVCLPLIYGMFSAKQHQKQVMRSTCYTSGSQPGCRLQYSGMPRANAFCNTSLIILVPKCHKTLNVSVPQKPQLLQSFAML